MTKEEIKKAILDDEECLDGIVDIIYQFKSEQEEPKIRFLQNEIVFLSRLGYVRFGTLEKVKEIKHKIPPEVLAATVAARIPGAKWAAVDKDSTMYFYTDEPVRSSTYNCWFSPKCKDTISNPYCIPCPVEDWKKAKWRLE